MKLRKLPVCATALEADPQPKAELALREVGPRAGDLGEAVQLQGAIGIGQDVAVEVTVRRRDIAARVVELRRVGEVERFGPELQRYFLGGPRLTEKKKVPAANAGAAQQVPARSAEAEVAGPQTPHRVSKGERVEIGVPCTDEAGLRHVALDQIGALRAFRRVECGAVSRHAEWLAAQEADEVVDLPAAHDPRQRAAVAEPLTPLAERQLGDVGNLQIVSTVEVAERAVEVEELRDGDARGSTADRVVAVAHPGGRDGLRPGVV